MTEKRFEIDEDGNITDTKTDRTLYVENRYTECDYYVNLLNELFDENEQLKKALRVAYSTNLTEPTKNTIERIAKHCGVDLE